MAEKFSSDAKALVQGYSSEQQSQILGQAKGNKATSGEVSGIIQSLGIKPSEVFGAANVSQTNNNPASVNLSDLSGISQSIKDKLGWGEAQTNLTNANNALLAFDGQNVADQQGITQRLAPQEVLRGESATMQAQKDLERIGLSNTVLSLSNVMQAITSEYDSQFNIAQQNRSEISSLMVNAPGAGITFADTIESAVAKTAKWNKDNESKAKKEAEEQDEKAYKQSLKGQLISLGISTKTSKGGSLSTKNMEKALTDYGMETRELEKLKARNASSASAQKAAEAADLKQDKLTQEMLNDVFSLQKQMDESAGSDNGVSWADAWSHMVYKYGFDPNNEGDVKDVDELLGLRYRDKYDK